MMASLSSREKRMVAVLILLALIAGAWLLIAAPLIDGFSVRAAQRDLLRLTYERNSRLINSIPAMRRRAEQIRPLAAQLAITAPDASQAQDRLRERLQKAFSDAGGQVGAAQSVSANQGQARAWVEGKLSLPDLQALLVALESAPPYLTVESLRISADSALESGHLDRLDVRLEVSVPHLRAPV